MTRIAIAVLCLVACNNTDHRSLTRWPSHRDQHDAQLADLKAKLDDQQRVLDGIVAHLTDLQAQLVRLEHPQPPAPDH